MSEVAHRPRSRSGRQLTEFGFIVQQVFFRLGPRVRRWGCGDIPAGLQRWVLFCSLASTARCPWQRGCWRRLPSAPPSLSFPHALPTYASPSAEAGRKGRQRVAGGLCPLVTADASCRRGPGSDLWPYGSHVPCPRTAGRNPRCSAFPLPAALRRPLEAAMLLFCSEPSKPLPPDIGTVWGPLHGHTVTFSPDPGGEASHTRPCRRPRRDRLPREQHWVTRVLRGFTRLPLIQILLRFRQPRCVFSWAENLLYQCLSVTRMN